MYYVAVDGGGTKTEAIVADETGRIVGRGKSGGSNPNFVGGRQAIRSIREAIDQACRFVDRAEIARIALCVPGLQTLARGWMDEAGWDGSRVLVDSDVRSTFYGTLGETAGVVVLAGTGSFVIGMGDDGRTMTVGGWGPVVGDAGSGQQIAAEALRAVTRYYDGLGPATALTEKVMQYYGIDHPQQLKAKVSVDNIGKLAPMVAECARANDEVALRIVAGEAEKLAEMAVRVVSGLEMDEARYVLAVAGGVANFGPLLMEPFETKLRRSCARIRIGKPFLSPACGALLLAYREDGIAWTEALKATLSASFRTCIDGAGK